MMMIIIKSENERRAKQPHCPNR